MIVSVFSVDVFFLKCVFDVFYQRICETNGFFQSKYWAHFFAPPVVDEHMMDGMEAANR